MPTAPLRPCLTPKCGALVRSGRCDRHGGPETHRWNTDRRADVVRIRGARLQAMRRQLFAREPLCRMCRQQDRTSLATIRDHILNLAEGGTEDEENCQPLCQACSDLKTHEEAQRGKR